MKKLLLILCLFVGTAKAQIVPVPVTKTVHITWVEPAQTATNVGFFIYRMEVVPPPMTNPFVLLNASTTVSPITHIPVTDLFFDDKTAVLGKTYTYQVTAVNDSGESAPGTPLVTVFISPPPLPPTNVKAVVSK